MRTRWIQALTTWAMVAGMLAAPVAHAGRTIDTAVIVSKSENKNQVHYSARVDDACMPVGSRPVYAYWRMLERGPTVTEPLLSREQQAYGIAKQTVAGAVVRLTLRALPTRPLTLRFYRTESGTCAVSAEMAIGGKPAWLFNVHVSLGFLRVDHLLITGWSEPDGHVVRERVDP